MNEIASYILGKRADAIPRFILSRLFPPEEVAKEVEIRLRGKKPFSISTGVENPNLDIYFEVTNLSPLKLTLDRVLIDFWVVHPTFEGAMLKRHTLVPRKTVKDIHYRHHLTPGQQRQLESFNNHTQQGHIYVYLTAYIESRVGTIEVKKIFEYDEI